MLTSAGRWALLVIAICCGVNASFAGEGAWKYTTEDRGQPELSYSESDKTIFFVGCGRAFGIHAVYPGSRKEDGTEAVIKLTNSRATMELKGEIDSGYGDDPPNTTHFVQWDLGFRRQDPDLYMKKWQRMKGRLFDLLDAGKPLTVSAEGRSYSLPAINVPGWRARFEKRC